MTAGTEYNTNGAYGTVKSLEDATVHVLAELDPAEAPVTIGGAEYKQFVQASTAANSEGADSWKRNSNICIQSQG